MRIHVLQFDERVGLGTFSRWIAASDCEVVIWRCDLQQWPGEDASGPVILLGGYMGVGDLDRFPYLQKTADWLAVQVKRDRPILAICLGSQLLAHALGAAVYSQSRQEKGLWQISLTEAGRQDPLFHELPDPFVSFEWHNDSFDLPDLPEGCLHLAETETCTGQAFRSHNAWGVQFHPEVDARIVTDWCQRTGAGEEPLLRFQDGQQTYFAHTKQLLNNFIAFAKDLVSQ